MKWRLKNIIIFNYSNNKKFSILTILLYIYVYRNPKIRPRRVREENHPRLLQFPIPKNPREPYSSPMPKKIRVYSNGGRSARSCIQIGVLVTRTIFHENISGGGAEVGVQEGVWEGFLGFPRPTGHLLHHNTSPISWAEVTGHVPSWRHGNKAFARPVHFSPCNTLITVRTAFQPPSSSLPPFVCCSPPFHSLSLSFWFKLG